VLRDFSELFHGWLLNPDTGAVERIPTLASIFWTIDKALISTLIVILLLLLIRPRLPYLAGLGVLGLCLGTGTTLIPWDRLAFVIGRTPNDSTILFAVLACATLACGVRLLMGRSRDRLIGTIVGASVFTTSLLFHLLVLHGILYEALQVQADRLERVAADAVIRGDADALQRSCALLQADCRVGSIETLIEGRDPFLAGYVANALANRPPGVTDMRFTLINGAGTKPQSHAPYAVAYADWPGPEGPGLLIVDDTTVLPIHAAAATVFFGLMTAAHTVWILGAATVVVVHDRRLHRRRRGIGAELRRISGWLRRDPDGRGRSKSPESAR